jgi:gas vesicle protein
MADKSINSEMYRQRADGSNISAHLTFLLIGGGIGAVLALLFAPKSGQEFRGDISNVTRKDSDRASTTASQIRARASEYYEAERESASERYAAVAKQTGDLANAARDAASGNDG